MKRKFFLITMVVFTALILGTGLLSACGFSYGGTGNKTVIDEVYDLSCFRIPNHNTWYNGNTYQYNVTISYDKDRNDDGRLWHNEETKIETFCKEITAEEYRRSFLYENRNDCVYAEITEFEFVKTEYVWLEPAHRIEILSGNGCTVGFDDPTFLSFYGFEAAYKLNHVTIYLSQPPKEDNFIMMSNREYAEWTHSEAAAELRGGGVLLKVTD